MSSCTRSACRSTRGGHSGGRQTDVGVAPLYGRPTDLGLAGPRVVHPRGPGALLFLTVGLCRLLLE